MGTGTSTVLQELVFGHLGPEQRLQRFDAQVQTGRHDNIEDIHPEKLSSDDADSTLVEMLSTNCTLTGLDILDSDISCTADVFVGAALPQNQSSFRGLSQNKTLQNLAISVNADGAEHLMTALLHGYSTVQYLNLGCVRQVSIILTTFPNCPCS